jgi:3-hydroxybutyryl-CoA dehydrogenase
MKLLVLADATMRRELGEPVDQDLEITWAEDLALVNEDFQDGSCIDLLFKNSRARIEGLRKLNCSLVIVNSVVNTLDEIDNDFIRINGWPTFLLRNKVEAFSYHNPSKQQAEKLFSFFQKSMEWVSDVPGMVTARIVSSIINEAYFALEENVSSKQEIDVAMKLGTNYPYGPFEWSSLIGMNNIYELLNRLSLEKERYKPAGLLVKEAKA